MQAEIYNTKKAFSIQRSTISKKLKDNNDFIKLD